jgi:hypothetical protein
LVVAGAGQEQGSAEQRLQRATTRDAKLDNREACCYEHGWWVLFAFKEVRCSWSFLGLING